MQSVGSSPSMLFRVLRPARPSLFQAATPNHPGATATPQRQVGLSFNRFFSFFDASWPNEDNKERPRYYHFDVTLPAAPLRLPSLSSGATLRNDLDLSKFDRDPGQRSRCWFGLPAPSRHRHVHWAQLKMSDSLALNTPLDYVALYILPPKNGQPAGSNLRRMYQAMLCYLRDVSQRMLEALREPPRLSALSPRPAPSLGLNTNYDVSETAYFHWLMSHHDDTKAQMLRFRLRRLVQFVAAVLGALLPVVFTLAVSYRILVIALWSCIR